MIDLMFGDCGRKFRAPQAIRYGYLAHSHITVDAPDKAKAATFTNSAARHSLLFQKNASNPTDTSETTSATTAAGAATSHTCETSNAIAEVIIAIVDIKISNAATVRDRMGITLFTHVLYHVSRRMSRG